MFIVSEYLVYLLRASLLDQLAYSLDLEGWHVAFFDVHDFERALLDGYHFIFGVFGDGTESGGVGYYLAADILYI